MLFFFFLFLNRNICYGYSKETCQCDGSFEHPKHMFERKTQFYGQRFAYQDMVKPLYTNDFFLLV